MKSEETQRISGLEGSKEVSHVTAAGNFKSVGYGNTLSSRKKRRGRPWALLTSNYVARSK